MPPRDRPRQEIIELLGRATEQAQHAEAYHAAAANPAALEGRAAQQAANDAAAMQLIELAGCVEKFTRDCGDPGTTLARLDDALRPVFQRRTEHTHPETGAAAASITPRRLAGMMDHLRKALSDLDADTLQLLPPGQVAELRYAAAGLTQIGKDGVPDPDRLRPRDLHYAGYYREIQFGRLAKASGLFDNWGKSDDLRRVDVNAAIFAADDLAHKFHALREGPDKSTLPISVVASEHRRVPGRALSELLREMRHEYQTPAERLNELEIATAARDRAQYRGAVHDLATSYADITGDMKAAALIRDYVQRQEPRLELETIVAMRAALLAAAAPDGRYTALPQTVRDRCLHLCFALDEQGHGRLIGILEAAEDRERAFSEALALDDDEDAFKQRL